MNVAAARGPLRFATVAPGQVVRRIEASAPTCFLTFDDGPDPEWTPRVLDALAHAGARATFFVVGRLARAHATLLRAAHDAGHAVGNHAYGHRHAWTLTRGLARRELRDGADAVAQAIGARPAWFRPPHGRLGAFLVEAAREEGQCVALWSVSAIDWGPLARAPRILERLQRAGAGDIVLMHDGPLRHNRPDQTLQALPELLRTLPRRGLGTAPLPGAATIPG